MKFGHISSTIKAKGEFDMLCQFTFKNFMSYRDETVFDFQAESLHEFEDSLIRMEKCSDLLPVSVIYGPNGGGKSNLLHALACLISTVVTPILQLQKSRTRFIIQDGFICVPFKFDETSKKKPTEFQIYFRIKGYEYQYNLSLFEGKIVAESLSRRAIGGKKPAHIFDRQDGEITLGPSLEQSGINVSVNEKMPFLSFLAINYNIPVIADAQEWFESCFTRSYGQPDVEKLIFFSDKPESERQIVRFMNDMGIDISGYRFDKEQAEIYMKRTIGDKTYELPFREESDGTKKLFSVLPLIMIALQEGRLVVVDELDAKLHPKLLRYIISLFTNPEINQHGAQLLFTSHDMSTMKNTVFRRDEIWFAAQTEDKSSEIYSLYEIRQENNERVNSTAAFDKQYLEGRYGADPYLQNMIGSDWNEPKAN